VKGADGELLVTGSANPSFAAFLAPAAKRNAEAVVADQRTGAGSSIGLEALLSAPAVTSAEWDEVAERHQSREREGTESSAQALYIAIPSEAGFSTNAPLEDDECFDVLGDADDVLGSATVDPTQPSMLLAPEVVRDAALFLRAQRRGLVSAIVVHRPEEIAKNIGGDTRRELRRAIGALEEDPTQLEALLKITEKVVFDTDDIIRQRGMALRVAATPAKQDATAQQPGSLLTPARIAKQVRLARLEGSWRPPVPDERPPSAGRKDAGGGPGSCTSKAGRKRPSPRRSA
jgi:hypothetical protein